VFHWLDWVAIGVYIAFALGVGTLMAKRASRSTKDFYLAGRSLPWWVAGTSIVATSFAADTPLVVTGWVRSAGISQNWLWWGMASGGALSIIVLAAWWRRLEVTTDAEIIEHRYGGKQAKALRGFLGAYHALVTNTIVLTWVLVAMKKVIRVVLDLPDDSYDVAIVGGGLALALSYSFLSGFWGVVITDFFQFFLALFGALLLAYNASEALGGMEAAREAFAALDENLTNLMPSARTDDDGNPLGWLNAAAWTGSGFGAFLIFVGIQGWLNKNADGGGAAVQRYSACKDEHHARAAALWYHIAHYALRPWPWIFVALASLVLVDPALLPQIDGVPDHEAAYPYMMANYLGPGLFGLMCASFLAAFMSTLDTHFNLASAYLVNDCYRRFLAPNRNPRHYVWVGRYLEIMIGIMAAGMALVAGSIADLFTFSLSLIGGLGPAMLLRWFWSRANAWTEISAMVTSTTVTIAILLYKKSFSAVEMMTDEGLQIIELDPPEWTAYPLSYGITIICAVLVMVTVTLLTKPVSDERLKQFYAKVRPVGAWKRVAAAARAENPAIDTGARGQGFAVIIGWIGGAALIYGLVFLPGRWMLGDPWGPSLAVAFGGAIALKWAWRRAVA
jgi:solute:Na+ symporter, SSS family